jgi:hypothetical protein
VPRPSAEGLAEETAIVEASTIRAYSGQRLFVGTEANRSGIACNGCIEKCWPHRVVAKCVNMTMSSCQFKAEYRFECDGSSTGEVSMPFIPDRIRDEVVGTVACGEASPFTAEDLQTGPMLDISGPWLGLPTLIDSSPADDSNKMHQEPPASPMDFMSMAAFPETNGSDLSIGFEVSATSAISSEVLSFPPVIPGRCEFQPLPGVLPQLTTSAGIRAGRDSGGQISTSTKQASRPSVSSGYVTKLTSEEIKSQRAKRNRESAKRSRMKTKLMHQAMTETFDRLQEENRALRAVIDKLVASAESISVDGQEKQRGILSDSCLRNMKPSIWE